LGLGVRQGHRIAIRAAGAQARAALEALQALVESGLGESAAAPESVLTPQLARPADGEWMGEPASPGVAIGPAVRLRPVRVQASERHATDPQAEWQWLQAALRSAQADVRALREWAAGQMGEDQAAIFDAHLLFLQDPALIEAAAQRIRAESLSADFAWQAAVDEMADSLRRLDDAYLQARAADVLDVGQRVLRKLAPQVTAAFALEQPAILVGHDVTPSDVKAFEPDKVLGVCLEAGCANAHSVILLRAMDIPVVVGLGPRLATLAEGTPVALDGQQGVLWVAPEAATTRELELRRHAWQAARQTARVSRHQLAATRDGWRVRVLANLNSVADVASALDAGAEGVGVLRTEFLFTNRKQPPTEEEQVVAYQTIAGALGARRLVIRTLDAGGDKPLAYVDMRGEANPFLGWRGLRVSLGRPDLLKTQLRAILRASSGHHIEIMFPMVSVPSEVREAKSILREAQSELRQAGIAFDETIKVGIMIEVPAAAAVADQLAREANFFSIGSNDLSQYVMAADRTNPRVAFIADHYQPAVLRMIRQTARAARRAGIPVGLCGELGGDPLAMPVLIGLGLDELSMSAPAIPHVKQAIANLTVSEAQAAAAEVLSLDSGLAVRRYLVQRFAPA
jgi:phosphocarrier protein FPr